MSSLDPIDIISRGLKINPRITRIAFGIPIVLASIAIGTSLFGDIVSAAYAFIGGIFSCVMVLILSIASYHIAKPGASNHWTLPIVKSLTWFCAVLFMGVCLVIFGTWASGIPFAAAISKIITNPPPTTIEGRLHFNMLPANNVAEIDKSQLEAYVARKKVDIGGTPSLRLNQAVIGVDRAADPNKIVVIYGNSIAMDGASRINANGNNVLLLARNIKFDSGALLEAGVADTVAPPGQNGRSAGDLFLYAMETIEGSLSARLGGQAGGRGADGAPGRDGATGAKGSNASSSLFDCRRGAGRGGDGAPGEPGQPGRPGGKGGNGGNVYLATPDRVQFQGISLEARGGAGGGGGQGGLGGKGGKGGEGGSPVGLCSGSGPRGADGPNGLPGPPGPNGVPGSDGELKRSKLP